MKKVSLFLCAFCISVLSFAQKPTFDIKELKSREDMDPMAKKAVTYVLSMPADTSEGASYRLAGEYLFVWMDKTEDHSFPVYITTAKIMQESKAESYVLFAAMTEYAFKEKSIDEDELTLYAIRRLINYTKDPANNIMPGPELQNLIAADKKGRLKKYLAEEK